MGKDTDSKRRGDHQWFLGLEEQSSAGSWGKNPRNTRFSTCRGVNSYNLLQKKRTAECPVCGVFLSELFTRKALTEKGQSGRGGIKRDPTGFEYTSNLKKGGGG